VAPSERPVLPSIDPIFGSGILPARMVIQHSNRLSGSISSGPNLHRLIVCDAIATYRRVTYSPASSICRCIAVPNERVLTSEASYVSSSRAIQPALLDVDIILDPDGLRAVLAPLPKKCSRGAVCAVWYRDALDCPFPPAGPNLPSR
jgi:hypothetical protein